MPRRRPSPYRLLAATAIAWALTVAPAWAEKADRAQKLAIEADQKADIDMQGQLVAVWTGNAVLSQGSLQLRAERIEIHEQPDGYYAGSAVGSAAKPATWRQRSDRAGESVEGQADRIEFDGHSNTLKLLGNASARRLRDGQVADEITGATIVWDNLTGVFKVDGGVKSTSNPSGRLRMVLTPRPEAAAAGASSGAASAPPALTPSRSLGGP
ncbi:MAG: lipopolysaccharide transport periplasmic protein LptA [Burkholderiales bacterium]|nr:lipopolysaccharide transport periplasmic protein LptA [Burkholderiales bacterium]MDE1928464.1 lipopolysaccharide transport periplasmic protein LptA [Burkholderiales bacterium]